ncbi:MAG: HAMP domain-containing histidine kinase [Clostridia bacterium]|nr:HAMP domain-containing histidine kinase [Clostridia bacterium]
MFKSTFAKYLITFTVIILISFLILSGIIASMIRAYSTEEKENQLISTSTVIAAHLENTGVENLEAAGALDVLSSIIMPLINRDTHLDIILTSADGRVILSTINTSTDNPDGLRHPVIVGELGSINIEDFEQKETTNDTVYFHRGDLNDYLDENSIVCAHDVSTGGINRGYVISLYSTSREDRFVKMTRNAVLHSSAWVMLAAVIAVYFITERMIRPLKNMTTAAKKFGKGDFSTRVTVYGSDEVAELSLAFNNMADSLEKLDTMRSSFLANVSHDLRTPMTTIASFIDGIMSGAIPPEKQGHYLQIISSEVHRLSRLVTQLLDVSRLESGDRKMAFEDFDVAEVARIILISFENQIEEKQLDVEFDAEEDEIMAFADKDAIHQVIYNLCHNAIKFANNGGKFRIKIESIDSKRIRISVYDDGQVISDEEAGMIFERFYKTDQSRGMDKNGVGLGLYICKTIIDAHDEEIGVNSVADEGTEFWFTLKKTK